MEWSALASRLRSVRSRIDAARRRSPRAAPAVTLVAVTKTRPPETIRALLDLGVTDIGENRVQEAWSKASQVPRHPPAWHLIGHLQRTKLSRALDLFDRIQSVDSFRLAAAIDQQAVARGLRVPILLEINVAREPQKHGFAPEETRDALARCLDLSGVDPRGLMCMTPLAGDPETSRPWFRAARELRDESARATGADLPDLSMGMTQDFEVAVEGGATCVRVGRALFP